ncbi:MAG: hypothetical protein JNL57_07245 [Bacteroidetes bacterium]|nr:hypothetical protein [Bacteroidota bacterium]
MKSSASRLLLCCLFITASSLHAHALDSLLQKALSYPDDSLKIEALFKLNDRFWNGSADSVRLGMKYLQEAQKIAERNGNRRMLVRTYQWMATNSNVLGNPTQAVTYFYISLREAEKIRYKDGIARSNKGIGVTLYSQGMYKRALQYLQTALDYQDSPEISWDGITLFYLIGLCRMETKDYINAQHYLLRALKASESENYIQRKYECCMALGELSRLRGELEKALEYCNKALPYQLAKKEYIALSWIYTTMGEVYLQRNQLTEAEKYAVLSLHNSRMHIYKPRIAVSAGLLHKVYAKKGKYELAYKYLFLKDSIQKIVNANEQAIDIAIIQAGFEFEKKENILKSEQKYKEALLQSKLEKQERRRNQALVLALLALLAIVIIAFAYRFVLKQRRISEKLLLNILPKETAAELKAFGRAKPRVHPSVTIVFCDIKSFTVLAESLGPEQLVDMLDFYFRHFDQLMEKYQLEKIKTIGDAYMYAAGLHNPASDDAHRALMAAMDMITYNKSAEEQMQTRFGCHFQFRIGIHTGTVISGVVGQNKYAYDIWGDAVNIAARMEQSSEPGHINISGQTHALIKDRFQCEYRGKIDAKNKGAIDMYFVKTK